jgi:hypothetical protein
MNKSQTSIQDRTGILFFQAMNQAFGSTIGTSTLIPVQLLVVNRERAANLYSVLPFYCATFVITLPLELIPQLMYCSLVRPCSLSSLERCTKQPLRRDQCNRSKMGSLNGVGCPSP